MVREQRLTAARRWSPSRRRPGFSFRQQPMDDSVNAQWRLSRGQSRCPFYDTDSPRLVRSFFVKRAPPRFRRSGPHNERQLSVC
jgi:hypothetical protein